MFTKYRLYRMLKTLMGYRSFVKENEGQTTYILVYNMPDDLVLRFIKDGYVEEKFSK